MIKDLGASRERQKVCEVSVMQNIHAPHSKTKSTAVCMMMGPGGANFLAVGGVFYTSESKKQSLNCAARRTRPRTYSNHSQWIKTSGGAPTFIAQDEVLMLPPLGLEAL